MADLLGTIVDDFMADLFWITAVVLFIIWAILAESRNPNGPSD